MEASNLPDTKFKTMIIKMLKELSENFSKEITSIKKGGDHKKETEMKNTRSEMKKFMYMGCTYVFFDFSVSYNILNLSPSILCLSFMLLIPCTFPPHSNPPHSPLPPSPLQHVLPP